MDTLLIALDLIDHPTATAATDLVMHQHAFGNVIVIASDGDVEDLRRPWDGDDRMNRDGTASGRAIACLFVSLMGHKHRHRLKRLCLPHERRKEIQEGSPEPMRLSERFIGERLLPDLLAHVERPDLAIRSTRGIPERVFCGNVNHAAIHQVEAQMPLYLTLERVSDWS